MVKKKATRKKTPPRKKTAAAKSSTKRTSATKRTTRKKKAQKPVGTCFVLMPFRDPFDTYFDAIIKPAIEATNLEPLRGDSLFRPSPIMADVWSMIQSAELLIAELTTKNANVFYELGLAHAIGKPVILIAETIDDVPFDLQQLRVLLYDKADPAWGQSLRDLILKAIEETTSTPVESVPTMFRKAVKSQAPEQSEAVVRIALLERQMAAIKAQTQGRIHSSDAPYEHFRKGIGRIISVGEGVEVVKQALESGIPLNVVERQLKRFSPSERQEILEGATGDA